MPTPITVATSCMFHSQETTLLADRSDSARHRRGRRGRSRDVAARGASLRGRSKENKRSMNSIDANSGNGGRGCVEDKKSGRRCRSGGAAPPSVRDLAAHRSSPSATRSNFAVVAAARQTEAEDQCAAEPRSRRQSDRGAADQRAVEIRLIQFSSRPHGFAPPRIGEAESAGRSERSVDKVRHRIGAVTETEPVARHRAHPNRRPHIRRRRP